MVGGCMFDYKKVVELGSSVISRDGSKVYNGEEIIDERTKDEAKIASLIYEEALLKFTASKDEQKPFDYYCNKAIATYSLNGEITADPINKAIQEILANDHMTVTLETDSLYSSPYSFLAQTEKDRRGALLRYLSRSKGFAFSNLVVDFDQSNRILSLKYDRSLENKSDYQDIFALSPSEKIEYAENRLKALLNSPPSKERDSMIPYWEEIISSLKGKLNTFKSQQP